MSDDPVIPHPFIGDGLTCDNWSGSWPEDNAGFTLRSSCGWLRDYHTEEGAVNTRQGPVGSVKTVDGEHIATCADEKCVWTSTSTKDGQVAHELIGHEHIYPEGVVE